MPVVRPYPIAEIEPRAIPTAAPHVAAAGDLGSFGGNQARDLQVAGANLDRAGDAVFSIYEREAREANESRIQDFNNQFILGKQELLLTGPNAYYKLKGADAIQGAAAATDGLKKLKDGLLGQTANPYQRQRLGAILDSHFASAADQIARHVNQQQLVYDRNVALASIDVAEREAISNPENLGAAVTRATEAARTLHKGQAPEVIESEALKAGSGVIASAIKDRLVRNDPAAVTLFRQYESRLDPKDRLALGSAVETLSNSVEASDWVRSRSAGPTSAQAVAGIKTSMAHWQADGYSAPVAAGITAGFLRESQFYGGAVNPRDGRDGSDSINIGQWNGPRGAAFNDFVKKNGLEARDPRTGLAYAKAEIDGVIPYSVSGLSPDFKARLQSAKSEKEAADIMTRGYFRPKHTEGESAIRQGSASAILAQYGKPPSTGDQALDAVNAATGMSAPAPLPSASTLAQEGVVDFRRQMIDAEQRRIALTQQNEREFAGDPVRMRANQAVIESEYTKSKAIVQAGKDKLYADLQDWMSKSGPGGGPAVTMPPATIMSQLTYEQQNSVERQINRNIEGKKAKTDQGAWYALQSGLTSDNANVREMWAGTNLMQFREHLSDQDFQELAKLQAEVRKGGGKYLTEAQTINQMVNSTLLQLGIDPTPKPDTSPTGDAAKAAKFHRAFQDELTTFETNKGKKATPQEVQGIIDGLVKAGAKSGWFNQTDVPVFMLGPADVPAKDRTDIIAAIRKAGGVPTEERVVEVYRHKLAMEPRQTEIPRPSPAAGVQAGTEAIGVGTSVGGGAAARPAVQAAIFPRSSLPAPARPRVIDNPPEPVDRPPPRGPMSRPLIETEADQHDESVRALRLRLGLEVR
ncbi:MAG: hypothetical protein KIS73_29010 [Enhydrobacter sp.]|nr:hypothetical protein [Enhydrobacter sp.]